MTVSLNKNSTGCSPSEVTAIEESSALEAAEWFKALADPLRVRMVSAIMNAPDGELCVCDLNELSPLSQPTISHHLKLLRDANILTSERRGTWVWYSIEEANKTVTRNLLQSFTITVTKPQVLFVCVHNAGRSQMAAGFLRHFAGDRVAVLSAGSIPADEINPMAVKAMLEEGIDIRAQQPKVLTDEGVEASDVVITMGCGDACPFYPGKRYEDWVLEDPAGLDLEAVRKIRDDIKSHVQTLLADLFNYK